MEENFDNIETNLVYKWVSLWVMTYGLIYLSCVIVYGKSMMGSKVIWIFCV